MSNTVSHERPLRSLRWSLTCCSLESAAAFIIALGAFSFGPLCNAVVAINATSDSAKTGALGLSVFAGNLGGLESDVLLPPTISGQWLTQNAVRNLSFSRTLRYSGGDLGLPARVSDVPDASNPPLETGLSS